MHGSDTLLKSGNQEEVTSCCFNISSRPTASGSAACIHHLGFDSVDNV